MRKQVIFLLFLFFYFPDLPAKKQRSNPVVPYRILLAQNIDSLEDHTSRGKAQRADSLLLIFENLVIEEKLKNRTLFIYIILLVCGAFLFAYISFRNRKLFLKEKQEKEFVEKSLAVLESKNKDVQTKWENLQSKKSHLEKMEKINQSKIQLFDRSVYKVSDILYFEKKGDPVYYYTKDEQFHQPTYVSLISIEKDLVPMPPFIRIHSKYLINMSNIKKLDGNEVVMVNDIRLKIANRRRREVIRKVDRFFRNNRPSKNAPD